MAHAEAEVQDNLEAVVDLIGSLHSGGNIKWYCTLNNSTSTRPKDHGGIPVKSMGQLRLPASGGWPFCMHFINAVSDRHWKM